MASPPPSILSATSLPSNIPHGIYLGPSGRHSVSTNDIAASFWSDCLSFGFCATTTIAITTTSLISDWLLLRLLRSLSIPGYTNLSLYATTDSDLGQHLHPDPTDILHVIVIISTVTYCMYFLWFLYMFSIQRSLIKDRWDGLPTKNTCLVKFGGEIFTFLIAVAQDIPVSSLLFCIQAAANCQFVVITENAIFLLATCSTLVSVIWKAGQVFWNSGCFGLRYEYLTSKGLVALRCTTLLTLIAAFALATCNIILLTGWKNSSISTRQLSNSVMEKVGVDRWWRQDFVVLVAGRSNTMTNQSQPLLESKVQVASMRTILKPEDSHLMLLSVIPCHGQNYDFTPFLKSDHRLMNYDSCTIYFSFKVLSDTMTIKHDFRYMLQANDSCWTGTLERFLQLNPSSIAHKSDNLSSVIDFSSTDDNDPSLTATTAILAGTNYASQAPDLQDSSFYSIILDSYMWPSSKYSCQYVLSRDESLLSRHNLCR